MFVIRRFLHEEFERAQGVTVCWSIGVSEWRSEKQNWLGERGQRGYLFNMSATEHIILETLIELDRQVKTMPTANPKPNLLPLFNRLDELTLQLPPQAAPELVHYLRKKSYEKARLFLEGRDAENAAGNCGHV